MNEQAIDKTLTDPCTAAGHEPGDCTDPAKPAFSDPTGRKMPARMGYWQALEYLETLLVKEIETLRADPELKGDIKKHARISMLERRLEECRKRIGKRQTKSAEKRPDYRVGEEVVIDREWNIVRAVVLKMKADGRLRLQTGALLELGEVVMVKAFAYEVCTTAVVKGRSLTVATLAPFRGDRSAPAPKPANCWEAIQKSAELKTMPYPNPEDRRAPQLTASQLARRARKAKRAYYRSVRKSINKAGAGSIGAALRP